MNQSLVKTLKNGVRIVETVDGILMHQCLYENCSALFVPKRRFATKYCCESCRVLAYRARKSNTSAEALIENKPIEEPVPVGELRLELGWWVDEQGTKISKYISNRDWEQPNQH